MAQNIAFNKKSLFVFFLKSKVIKYLLFFIKVLNKNATNFNESLVLFYIFGHIKCKYNNIYIYYKFDDIQMLKLKTFY